MIFSGDFNVDLKKMGGRGRGKKIAALVETSGLEDLVGHFLSRQRVYCKDWRTCAVVS